MLYFLNCFKYICTQVLVKTCERGVNNFVFSVVAQGIVTSRCCELEKFCEIKYCYGPNRTILYGFISRKDRTKVVTMYWTMRSSFITTGVFHFFAFSTISTIPTSLFLISLDESFWAESSGVVTNLIQRLFYVLRCKLMFFMEYVFGTL